MSTSSRTALRTIRNILSSHHDTTTQQRPSRMGGSGLPILSDKQIRRGLQMAQRYNQKQQQPHSMQTASSSSKLSSSATTPAAAVLVPLCSVASKPSLLFTIRSSNLQSHANEISFPGGHRDDQVDKNLYDTALRETEEELRGSYNYQKDITYLGHVGSVPSLKGIMVTPVVAALTTSQGTTTLREFQDQHHVKSTFHNPNPDEVSEIFVRSLEELVDSETAEPIARFEGGMGPVFPGKEGKIWGLTAIILRVLLKQVFVPAFFPDRGTKSSL